jgi:hypothetical protein
VEGIVFGLLFVLLLQDMSVAIINHFLPFI